MRGLEISRRMMMGGIAATGAIPAWAQSKAKPRALALAAEGYPGIAWCGVGLAFLGERSEPRKTCPMRR
jgi:hypothetical protein